MKNVFLFIVFVIFMSFLTVFIVNDMENYCERVDRYQSSVVITLESGIDVRVGHKDPPLSPSESNLHLYLQDYKAYLNDKLDELGEDSFKKTIQQDKSQDLVVIRIEPKT